MRLKLIKRFKTEKTLWIKNRIDRNAPVGIFVNPVKEGKNDDDEDANDANDAKRRWRRRRRRRRQWGHYGMSLKRKCFSGQTYFRRDCRDSAAAPTRGPFFFIWSEWRNHFEWQISRKLLATFDSKKWLRSIWCQKLMTVAASSFYGF